MTMNYFFHSQACEQCGFHPQDRCPEGKRLLAQHEADIKDGISAARPPALGARAVVLATHVQRHHSFGTWRIEYDVAELRLQDSEPLKLIRYTQDSDQPVAAPVPAPAGAYGLTGPAVERLRDLLVRRLGPGPTYRDESVRGGNKETP